MVFDTFVRDAQTVTDDDRESLQIQPGQIVAIEAEGVLVLIGRGDWVDADFDALIDTHQRNGKTLDDLCQSAWDWAGASDYDVWVIDTAHVCDNNCGGPNVQS